MGGWVLGWGLVWLRMHCVIESAGQPDPRETTAFLKGQCLELGFDLVGIAPAGPSQYSEYIRQWLASGQAGSMDWLTKHVEVLLDVRKLLEGVQSIICVAANYHFPLEAAGDEQGLIARYALGDDYHEVFKDRIHKLADMIRVRYPGTKTKCGVDITPIMEKPYAASAGIGWMGKNTCIIHPKMGSWLILGEVMTSLELVPDALLPDLCGSCTRCIDACPTGALVAPYQLDARRCVSYLTIENRGELSDEQQKGIGRWLVGCDACQDACPWNRKASTGTLNELRPRYPTGSVDLESVLQWDEAAYRANTRRSAIRRVKLPQLQAHAKTVMKNIASGTAPKASRSTGTVR